jgi:hypothetical protein
MARRPLGFVTAALPEVPICARKLDDRTSQTARGLQLVLLLPPSHGIGVRAMKVPRRRQNVWRGRQKGRFCYRQV